MKTAKVFYTGRSQAVRLPLEFRFDADEVFIRRDPLTGNVILSEHEGWSCWDEFFEHRQTDAVPDDFMAERHDDPPQTREWLNRLREDDEQTEP